MSELNFLSSQDAVSEVVDFVTVLGILVISIGLIGVAGYPLLKNAQEINQIENTKQSFVVLAENINKVVLGQAPSQSVELKMYGGTLSITGSSTINITARDSTGENITLADQQMRSIESTVGDTVIAYEGTAVWAKYPNGNTLLVYKPLITNQSNALVIPVVKVNPIGSASTGGSGMSRVTAKGVPGVTLYSDMSNIVVRINSSYSNGWVNYYKEIMSWDYCMGTDCVAQLNTINNIDVYILDIQLDAEVI